MILENGVFRTLDPSLPVARALAIAGDRIAGGVGTHETALASPDVVDLGGRCVLPGFNDAHVHFIQWALARTQLRLEDARSRDEAVAHVAEAVRARPGAWVTGTGWRDAEWPEPPTRQALDEVTGATPAALSAKDGHSLWLNSAALSLAPGPLDTDGGVVERDERGEPTGILREEAAWRFRGEVVLAEIGEDERLAAVRDALPVAAARGVTAVHDKDGGVGAHRIFQRLRDDEALTLRVWQSLPASTLDALEELPIGPGLGDDRLRIGYLKAFMDGTLGSRTARMLDGSGVEITSRDELADMLRRAARIGFPLAVHAIGDRANRDALDAFAETRDAWHPLGLRPRIEHAQCLADEDVTRFAELGVAASVQFTHAPSDRDLADRYWPGKTAYAWRSLWDTGGVVVNGSDAPIEELDPWTGVVAGVRRTLDERPPWRAEEALTLDEALVATCVNPAWLARDERRRGRLLPGYYADLVVLDRDPFACEPAELREVAVVATMVGGRWTHHPPPW